MCLKIFTLFLIISVSVSQITGESAIVTTLFPTPLVNHCMQTTIPLELRTHNFVWTVKNFADFVHLGDKYQLHNSLSLAFASNVYVGLEYGMKDDDNGPPGSVVVGNIPGLSTSLELLTPELNRGESLIADLTVVTPHGNFTSGDEVPTMKTHRGDALKFQWNLDKFSRLRDSIEGNEVSVVYSLKYIKLGTNLETSKDACPNLTEIPIIETPHSEFRHG